MTHSSEAIDAHHRFDDEKELDRKDCAGCGYWYFLEDLNDHDLCYDCSQLGDE